jgi:putative membrane protein
MIDLSYENYVWLKAGHILAAAAWGGGLVAASRCLSLSAGEEAPADWVERARRLMVRTANPALLLVLISGGLLTAAYGDWDERWLHVKIALVWILLLYHLKLLLSAHRHPEGWRLRAAWKRGALKMFPIVLFVGIVVLVVVRPF